MEVLDRGNNKFCFDVFKYAASNYNINMVGVSGTGKTKAAQDLIDQYLNQNATIFMMDIGRQYKEKCISLGGEYIDFNEKSAIGINPFSFINSVSPNQLSMLRDIFLVSAGIDQNNLKYQIAGNYFEKAIINSLQKYQSDSSYSTVHMELLEIAKSDNNDIVQELAISIVPFTTLGDLGAYFEGKSNLSLDNPLAVFDFEHIKHNLQLSDTVINIILFIIRQTMDLLPRETKKICIIEEVYDLFNNSKILPRTITNFYSDLKYINGSIVTITQSHLDLFISDLHTAFILNSNWGFTFIASSIIFRNLHTLLIDYYEKNV